MHALLCAAAGLTVSLSVAGIAEAAEPVRNNALDVLQFETGSIDPTLTSTSARFWDVSATRNVPAGETYGATLVGFSSAGGAFLDTLPDTGTFGGGFSDAGTHVVTGAQLQHVQNQVGNSVTVAFLSADSSDLVPAGLTLGGAPLDTLQFEVGFNNAPADPVFYPGFQSSDVISTQLSIFSDGNLLFSGLVAPGNSDFSNGLATIGAISNAGGIGGFDIDEIQITWNLSVPTPGAASVFGLAGLAAVRRRRR